MSGPFRRLLGTPFRRRVGFAAWTSGALSLGYAARQVDETHKGRQLPSGWRACCDGAHGLSAKQEQLPKTLQEIVGNAHVQLNVEQRGSRIGKGTAFAVVRPGTLQEAVDVLQACVDADACIKPQGANSGLTGGSVARDSHTGGPDRPTVVVNMRRLTSIIPIEDGKRLVCLAGAGINDVLQKAAEHNRESHSVLGSIFLNPSVAAGVAFGSGGTQLRKGPVYTERVLYARVNHDGQVELVNSLGLREQPTSTLFGKLEAGRLDEDDVNAHCCLPAHQADYASSVCTLDSTVSRFNAAITGPEPCRCEGKVLTLASVHETFPKPTQQRCLWLSCKDLRTAQQVKAEVLLKGGPQDLPSSVEYMDRDSVRAVDEAGRILCWMISFIGIGPTLGRLWDLKLMFEASPIPLSGVLADKMLYWCNHLVPGTLPPEVRKLASEYEHHLLINVGEYGGGELSRFEGRFHGFLQAHPGACAMHECVDGEINRVNYYRFATAPAFRTWCVGRGLEGVSVDYALPKAEVDAPLVPEADVALRMRYSHFGCNVVHEDIAFQPGVDAHEAHMNLKHVVEGMGGRLPAEHGHGTEYVAPKEAQMRWKSMDPLNVFNPGVGGLSVEKRYGGTSRS